MTATFRPAVPRSPQVGVADECQRWRIVNCTSGPTRHGPVVGTIATGSRGSHNPEHRARGAAVDACACGSFIMMCIPRDLHTDTGV
eukprot:CAMPEP_0119513762 /NCGR_PEP_ID=MMETSP1344-20130328/31782_1 /TAXON_ID=236787 /ORGANISM="Florenciella parvula, Strain CCMP2471" /LENGTH=85 /DNA_ID=CAMNT_0007551009 /DNA_START=147 /DNA_END=401 /DNA_ORIENTATION=-